MNRRGLGTSEPGEDVGEDGAERFFEDADQLMAGTGGIEERSENIEDGALAFFGEELPDRNHRFEGRVIHGSKEETGADFVNASGELPGWQVDPDAEGLEDIGATAFRSDPAIAVLDDADTGSGEHEDAGGRHIEQVEFVAVTPGETAGSLRRIDGNLTEGMKVIVEGAHYVTDGEKVRTVGALPNR